MTDIHIGRRTFIKKTAAAAAAVTVPGIIAPAATGIGRRNTAGASASTGNLIVPKAEGLKITGTFLDEISHDIPHQNWAEHETNCGTGRHHTRQAPRTILPTI